MNISKLKEKYETAKKSHDNFVKSTVPNESAYQDSCKKLKEIYSEYHEASLKSGNPIPLWI